jgi:hypothetical protein
MSQILRYDDGPVTIDARLLNDLWWALGMDEAPPGDRIRPLDDRVRTAYGEGCDPGDDEDLDE